MTFKNILILNIRMLDVVVVTIVPSGVGGSFGMSRSDVCSKHCYISLSEHLHLSVKVSKKTC